jgi:ParB-like chromosome segregation protein Spo0J
MIDRTISVEELKSLISFDHGCLVGDLPGDAYADKKHLDVLEELRQSIRDNGVTSPLRVVGNQLVDGHHRALVIMELGLASVPIVYEGKL